MRKEAGSTVSVCEGKEGPVFSIMHKEREDSKYTMMVSWAWQIGFHELIFGNMLRMEANEIQVTRVCALRFCPKFVFRTVSITLVFIWCSMLIHINDGL